jgi:UDP-N-acetylglucosamine--N-acetylmuramyl-(pentapeptide) pyrophosphoryl-undecaprenol N-acetylglucosamine transferase
MKAVFVGGHHNSALVVAKLMKKRGHQIFWFGHKTTMKQSKDISAEYKEIKKNNIPFYEIKAGKFYKNLNLLQGLKIIYAFFQSLLLLFKIKPDLLVSWGGYLSFPVCLSGFLLGIPAYTHEQTTKAGLANQAISSFVKKIFLTWPSSFEFFPKKKCLFIGLPLKKELFKKTQAVKVNNNKDKKSFFNNKKKTVFVVGGKQGSHFLNKLVKANLKKILAGYNLIHQSGDNRKTKDYDKLTKLAGKLPEDLRKNYILKPYFFEKEMVKVLKLADFAVSRAGAHICYELMALGKPAILVPISWVYKNEQYENALNLKEKGLGLILNEKTITSKKLLEKINFMAGNLEKFKKQADKAKSLIKKDADIKMVEVLEAQFQKQQKNQKTGQ